MDNIIEKKGEEKNVKPETPEITNLNEAEKAKKKTNKGKRATKASKIMHPGVPEISRLLNEWQKQNKEPSLEIMEQLTLQTKELANSLSGKKRKENATWLSQQGEDSIYAVMEKFEQLYYTNNKDVVRKTNIDASRISWLISLGSIFIRTKDKTPDHLKKTYIWSIEQARSTIENCKRDSDKMSDKLASADTIRIARNGIEKIQDLLDKDAELIFPGCKSLKDLEEMYLLHEMFRRREVRETIVGDEETERRAQLDNEIDALFYHLTERREHSIFSVRPLQPGTGEEAKDEARLFVPRDEVTRVREILALTDGGNFAVAGARGMGKSTLLHYIKENYKKHFITVHFSVPRKYETLDLFNAFFIKLCESVLSFYTQGQDQESDFRSAIREHPINPYLRIAAFLTPPLLIITILGFFDMPSGWIWRIILWSVGVFAGIAYGSYQSHKLKRKMEEEEWKTEYNNIMDSWGEGALRLVLQTRQHLSDLYFIQKSSQGLETEPPKIKIGITGSGVEAGMDISLENKRLMGWEQEKRAYTLPLITEAVKGYIEQITREKPLIIIFDDIDKMEIEHTDLFLRDLRTIFGIKCCYFFISGPPQYLEQLLTGLISPHEKKEPDTVIDDIITLEPTKDPKIEEILKKRLELRDLTQLVEDNTIGLIAKLADGNPRNAIRLLAGGFRNWVRGGGTAITPLHVLNSYLQTMGDGIKGTNNIGTLYKTFSRLCELEPDEEEYSKPNTRKYCKIFQNEIAEKVWSSIDLSELEKCMACSIIGNLKTGKNRVTLEDTDKSRNIVLEKLANAHIIEIHDDRYFPTPFGEYVSKKNKLSKIRRLRINQ